MSDPWVHRLSDYVDGELPAEDTAELEQHLAQCPRCTNVLADLRRLVNEAAALEDLYPRRDLWAGIAARIGAETVPSVDELKQEEMATSTVVSLDEHPRRRPLSFTLSQLLAACLALMIVSGGVGYFLRDTAPPRPGEFATAQSPVDRPHADMTAAATEAPPREAMAEQIAGLEKRIGELQATFEQYGRTLDPDVYATLEDNLFLLDEAIADWRGALTEDPQNEFLYAHLTSSLMRKVRLLQQASQIASTEI